jgi:hypothetical protein
MSVYEPGPANPPANGCVNTLGAASNSGYIGMIYMPSASASITSPYSFEVAGGGGVLADSFGFTGTMPAIAYNSSYAPVPPASRITG